MRGILSRAWANKPPVGTPLDSSLPLVDGLTHAYLLNESGGYTLYDLGHGFSGAVRKNGVFEAGTSTTLPIWAAGKDGVVLRFDATNHVNLGTAVLNGAAGTVAMRVMFDSFSAGRRPFSDAGGYMYAAFEAINELAFLTFDGSGHVTSPRLVVDLNRWYSLVCTWDSTSIVMHADGKLIGSASSGAILDTTTFAFRLGGSGLTSFRHLGAIGDCYIWKRALNQDEVMQLYLSPFELAAYAPMIHDPIVAAAAAGGWGALLGDQRNRLVGGY